LPSLSGVDGGSGVDGPVFVSAARAGVAAREAASASTTRLGLIRLSFQNARPHPALYRLPPDEPPDDAPPADEPPAAPPEDVPDESPPLDPVPPTPGEVLGMVDVAPPDVPDVPVLVPLVEGAPSMIVL
jgi:hypothetical protein